MRYRNLLVLTVVVVLSVGSPSAFAAYLTLDPGGSVVGAVAKDTVETYSVTYPNALPASGNQFAVDGASTATTTWSLSNDSFAFTFDDFRTTTAGALAVSYSGLAFIPSADTSYSIVGSYTSDAPDGRRTYLSVSVEDITAYPPDFLLVYLSEQLSEGTPAESFTLGQLGGDSYNQLSGSPTGTLLAGRRYALHVTASIATIAVAAPSAAHGTGFVTVTFVPEPSVGLLLLAGVVALAGVARR